MPICLTNKIDNIGKTIEKVLKKKTKTSKNVKLLIEGDPISTKVKEEENRTKKNNSD